MQTIRIALCSVLILLSAAAGAGASPSREQLPVLVTQLQQAPTDNVLREKIIKLAASIKPMPAVPPEANRAFVRGGVFQQEAKDSAGYELAISAYRDALRSAPWWGDAYYNLAVALESAGKFDEAIASLRNYMISVPAGSTEAGDAQNRIYVLEAKGEIAAKQAAIDAQVKAEKARPTIAGRWTIAGAYYFDVVRNGDVFTITGEMSFGKVGGWHATGVVADGQHLRFTVNQPGCPSCRTDYVLTLSPGGNDLTGTLTYPGESPKDEAHITRVP